MIRYIKLRMHERVPLGGVEGCSCNLNPDKSVHRLSRMSPLGNSGYIDHTGRQTTSSDIEVRSTWFMVDKQFWPRLGYGICSNTASWEELDSCLQQVYWQLVPKGGVRRPAPALLRRMDRGFYRMGCPHPGVECLVAQFTKLLVHYGGRSGLGLEMSVSMELLFTELGISSQPLCKSFLKYGSWVTNTWL